MTPLEIGAAVKIVIDGIETVLGIVEKLHGHGWLSVRGEDGRIIVYHESQLRALTGPDEGSH